MYHHFLACFPPEKARQKVHTIMLIYSVEMPLLQALAPKKIK